MKVSFGPLVFVILVVLAITAAFGFLLTPTEAANPSMQRAQATALLMQTDMDRALTATPHAYQSSLAEATLGPIHATATSIAISTHLQARAATATALALDGRHRVEEIALQEREAELAWRRNLDQIIFLFAIGIPSVSCVGLLAYVTFVLLNHHTAARTATLREQAATAAAQAELERQRRWRIMCEGETKARALPTQQTSATAPSNVPSSIHGNGHVRSGVNGVRHSGKNH